MRDVRHGPRLTMQARGVPEFDGGQRLDRNFSIERQIHRQIDDAGSAGADEALDLEFAFDVERQRAVVAALKAFLPERCVLWREEDTRPYECDGLTMYRQLPMVVALPETENQVAHIARVCFEMQVPIVPRGAR